MKQEGKGGGGEGWYSLYASLHIPVRSVHSFVHSFVHYFVRYSVQSRVQSRPPPPTTRGRKHCGPAWWGGEVVPTVGRWRMGHVRVAIEWWLVAHASPSLPPARRRKHCGAARWKGGVEEVKFS